MERKVLVICGTVAFLGLLSAGLGFAAEATRVKASDVLTRIPGECTYPKSPALYFGLASAIAVVIAQAILNTVAGCICCQRNTNPANANWTVALISFVVSCAATSHLPSFHHFGQLLEELLSLSCGTRFNYWQGARFFCLDF